MFASQLHEKMEVFACTIEVEANGAVQVQRVQMPRLMIEREFMALVQHAANDSRPIKVKLSREVPVYDQFEQRWLERENSITFSNNAYISSHKEEDSYAD